MSKLYITDIKEGENIEITLLVVKKEILVSKSGKPYINLALQDKSGQIDGKVWENVSEISSNFEKDDIVNLKTRVIKYQGKSQLNIQFITKISDDEINISDFLPSTRENIDLMVEDLKKILFAIKDRFLRELTLSFLQDSDFMVNFKQAPGATVIHHAFLGGLLEHTLSVIKLASLICQHYPFVNRDMIITSSFLHDIGKIREYRYSRSFTFTDEGRLLGHIIMGLSMVNSKMANISDFPSLLKMQVEHTLISHHGDYDFGSPKKPKTIEAMILHLADELDSKVDGMRSYIYSEKSDDENWTKYHRFYERYIYRKPLIENNNAIETREKESKMPEHLKLFDDI